MPYPMEHDITNYDPLSLKACLRFFGHPLPTATLRPVVKVCEETGQVFGACCQPAIDVLKPKNLYTFINMSKPCSHLGCLCQWSEGDTLRAPTPTERRDWHQSMRQLVAQATIEENRDL